MAKDNKTQENNGQKIRTKYERKIEERKRQEEKDKRDAKMMRIGAVAVCILIVAAIVGSIAASVLHKKSATKDAYLTVGSHQITKVEFDYYYYLMKNNYMMTYGSLLSYMGVDATQDLENQQYSGELTYKDLFEELAVEQIRQTKALADDAAAHNFTYDDTEDYAAILEEVKVNAETAGMSESQYYKSAYGEYATEENLKPFAKEGLLAAEYYDYLLEQNAPEEQEIKDYYAEHVLDYDRVDYHSFAVEAETEEDASEEDISKAMADAKEKADAMKKAREEGSVFQDLCLENASEENKTMYEDNETDASLREGAYHSGIPSVMADWLYEDGRAEGDVAVLEDEGNHQYYVVEFVNRYYDEADDDNISATLSSGRVLEYIEGMMENYTVTDLKGELKYLTVEDSAE